jgi:phosphohistidine phosphatase
LKKLFVVRHAKSSWALPGQSDFARPLNDEGAHDASQMAERLLLQNEEVDLFLSSPALRARQTCEAFCKKYQRLLISIQFEPTLYHAPCQTFYSVIEKISDEYNSIALFSHNPGITDFVNSLHTGAVIDNMPTCGVFALKIHASSWLQFSSAKKEFLFFESPKYKTG